MLKISRHLSLPLDAVTQKLAWLGRTGSGKTYGCKRLVEQMLKVGAQVVVLDGAGVWAGLRLGPNSFDVPVLGGLYGDIPLEPTAGALVADVIVDRGTSIVLDVSQMLDAERNRFATAFAQQFFQRKKAAPGAVHLVLEECQDYVPENQQRGEERMLHEFQRIAKQGRSLGIGLSLISQRPQEVSKKALNQAECVFAFQMTGPQERKALQYWLSDKGFEGKLADILPTLAVGAPHVWSPQWLKISKVLRILPIGSLDTSQTPKVGEKAFKQKKLEPIDLTDLSKAMAATIERAKQEDPKELRKRIAELEKALGQRDVKPEMIEVPVLSDEALQTINRCSEQFEQLVEQIRVTRASRVAEPVPRTFLLNEQHTTHVSKTQARAERKAAKNGAAKASLGNTVGQAGLRRMLIAIAQRPGMTNRQIGLRAGLSSRSGTFATYMSRARQSGFIEDEGRGPRLTRVGHEALGFFEPLPTGRALLEFWLRQLTGGASRMLAALADVYPRELTNEELGEAAGISARSGTFATYLSKLRTLELVTGRGRIRASEELFS